jgi:hypothetical protein
MSLTAHTCVDFFLFRQEICPKYPSKRLKANIICIPIMYLATLSFSMLHSVDSRWMGKNMEHSWNDNYRTKWKQQRKSLHHATPCNKNPTVNALGWIPSHCGNMLKVTAWDTRRPVTSRHEEVFTGILLRWHSYSTLVGLIYSPSFRTNWN